MSPSRKEAHRSRQMTRAPKTVTGFTEAERAAMRQRAHELRAASRGSSSKDTVDPESAVLAAIDAMSEPYRTTGKRLHAIIRASAPELVPRTWYGMPAYSRNGTVVCFFRSADKFKERYMTLGFNDEAKLDEGSMWPVAFALTELTPADAQRVAALLKRAIG